MSFLFTLGLFLSILLLSSLLRLSPTTTSQKVSFPVYLQSEKLLFAMNSGKCRLLAAHSTENKGYLCGYPSKGSLFFILFYYYIFIVCMCLMVNMWRSEDNLQKLVLSFHHIGPSYQTWVIRLSNRTFIH